MEQKKKFFFLSKFSILEFSILAQSMAATQLGNGCQLIAHEGLHLGPWPVTAVFCLWRDSSRRLPIQEQIEGRFDCTGAEASGFRASSVVLR